MLKVVCRSNILKHIIIFFIFLFNINTLLAQEECKFDNKLLTSILMNEYHPKKDIGYEYLISFNNKNDAKRVKALIPDYFIDNRTIDCQNKETCVFLYSQLRENKISNLDLGPFQINSLYHKHEPDKYFSMNSSYTIACNYLTTLVNEKGYNWYAIASYHSKTPSLNEIYKEKLIKNMLILNNH